MGPSAALTPAIWDKTIPYDGESFHLEYMELEEFLLENNLPSSPDALKDELAARMAEGELIPSEEMKVSRSAGVSAVTLMPIQELDKSEELLIITKSDSDVTCEVRTGEWEAVTRTVQSFFNTFLQISVTKLQLHLTMLVCLLRGGHFQAQSDARARQPR